MNIPEYYEDVSLKLTEVLDASGLREDIRWHRINTWLQIEELDRIWIETLNDEDDVYYFGSQAEATTTFGLCPDTDNVYLSSEYVVLHDIQLWVPSFDTKTTLLMVADESTPPGYVKLQLLQSDAPIKVCSYQDKYFLLDTEGNSVLHNGCIRESFLRDFSHISSSHGPAITMLMNGLRNDMVIALPCRYWPDQVFRRMSTARINYNWPTRKMMDVIKQTAVLLVPVGQRSSPEQHLEWRLSFSFAEKLLMMQFNSTQYKCFVMLKFIKNTFIKVHDVENVLTSYHCKTCMFYLIEDTPSSLWHPNNLMLCMDLCLRQLLSWVQSANCPNYFVPDENMFLGKLACHVQGKVARILQDLLQQNGRYISKISYENIGENVVRVCQSLRMDLYYPDECILVHTNGELMRKLDTLAFFCAYTNINKLSIFKSRHGPRHEIGNILSSLFCSALGNHLASQSLKQEMYHQENLIAAHEFLLLGSSSDVASGKLKLAAFYFEFGMLDTMEEVLNQVDANFTHTVYGFGDMFENMNAFLKEVHEHFSRANLIQKCFAFTVYYSPSDIHCIPKVLIFEIFRSTGSEISCIMLTVGSFPVAIVTAKVYLYFFSVPVFSPKRTSSTEVCCPE